MKPSKLDDARWTMKCLPSPPRLSEEGGDSMPSSQQQGGCGGCGCCGDGGCGILAGTTDTPDLGPIVIGPLLSPRSQVPMAPSSTEGVVVHGSLAEHILNMPGHPDPHIPREALEGIHDDILAVTATTNRTVTHCEPRPQTAL